MKQKLNAHSIACADLSDPGKLEIAKTKASTGTAVYVTFSYDQWNDQPTNSKAAKICREHGFLMQPNTSRLGG